MQIYPVPGKFQSMVITKIMLTLSRYNEFPSIHNYTHLTFDKFKYASSTAFLYT